MTPFSHRWSFSARRLIDPLSLIPLLTGNDAVLSALGPRGRTATSVCSTAVAGIIEAMAGGVRRIVAISAQPVLRGGAGSRGGTG